MSKFASLRNLCGPALAALMFPLLSGCHAPSGSIITDLHTPTGKALPISQEPSGYTIIDIGASGGSNSLSFGINDSGQVAGSSNRRGDDAQYAFRYYKGKMTFLHGLGGTNSEGMGINAGGQIAGDSTKKGDIIRHAVLWTDSAITDLARLEGQRVLAAPSTPAGKLRDGPT